jgi:acyl carrier protein
MKAVCNWRGTSVFPKVVRSTAIRTTSSALSFLSTYERYLASERAELLLTKYAEATDMLGFKADEVPNTFDFLLRGVIDSFGILEMISSMEDEFPIQLDMAAYAEQITFLGSLCQYVAEKGNRT